MGREYAAIDFFNLFEIKMHETIWPICSTKWTSKVFGQNK